MNKTVHNAVFRRDSRRAGIPGDNRPRVGVIVSKTMGEKSHRSRFEITAKKLSHDLDNRNRNRDTNVKFTINSPVNRLVSPDSAVSFKCFLCIFDRFYWQSRHTAL